jgi:hypothetical protein
MAWYVGPDYIDTSSGADPAVIETYYRYVGGNVRL